VLDEPAGGPPESEAVAVAESAAPPAFEPPVAEPAVGWVSQSGQGQPPPPMEMEHLEPSALEGLDDEPVGLRPEAPILMDDAVEPIDGLVGREVEIPEDADEFRVETSEDIILESAGGSEFQMPDASQELFAGAPRGTRAPFEEDAPVPPMAARDEAAAPGREDPLPEAVEPEIAEPEVAEPEVAEPYRWRFATAPSAPLAESEPSAPAPESVTAPAPVSAPEPPAAQAPTAPRRSYGATETGGQPIARVFKAILTARPPIQAAPPAVRPTTTAGSTAGAPTRPAADALSLSSVFGEEGSATPPAVPAPSAGSGAVSFDDFFGSPRGSSAARTPRAGDSKNDDLDQFHTWLQNLKR
jgi:hypothetical protein